MALEMFEDDYDLEVDIWALGIIFHEMLTGKRVWDHLKGVEVPSKRLTFPTAEYLGKVGSERWRELIGRMLKKNPKERPGIEEVYGYFDLLPLKKSVTKFKAEVEVDRVGEAYAKFEDVLFCRLGVGVWRGMLEKERERIVKEAEGGSRKAQFLLGKMYLEGWGVKADKKVA